MSKFGITVLFILIFLWQPFVVFAQEQATSSSPIATDSSEPVQEYTLPYPGLLPDSPFYILKTLRDKIVSMLIADNLKRAEFDLLQADKRLGGGYYLFEEGKQELAQSTLSKGENYFENALASVGVSQKAGQDTTSLLQRLALSATKHEKILDELISKATRTVKQDLIYLKKRVVSFEKKIEDLQKK